MDFDVLKRVLAALESHGVTYAIFGAVALNLHGLARTTEDLDIFIAPEGANIDRFKQALRSVFDDPETDNITERDLLGDYPAVQYNPPVESFYMDILTRLGTAFTFDDLETERVPYQDLTVTVITPKMLYKMKKDTVRLKDRADADLVRRRFNLEQD